MKVRTVLHGFLFDQIRSTHMNIPSVWGADSFQVGLDHVDHFIGGRYLL